MPLTVLKLSSLDLVREANERFYTVPVVRYAEKFGAFVHLFNKTDALGPHLSELAGTERASKMWLRL